MSQKNGHALESVTLTAMLRRWTSSLLLIAVTAASALSAMILQNLTIRQENALSSTIENTTISCTVTNAKGTDSGNLQILDNRIPIHQAHSYCHCESMSHISGCATIRTAGSEKQSAITGGWFPPRR